MNAATATTDSQKHDGNSERQNMHTKIIIKKIMATVITLIITITQRLGTHILNCLPLVLQPCTAHEMELLRNMLRKMQTPRNNKRDIQHRTNKNAITTPHRIGACNAKHGSTSAAAPEAGVDQPQATA